MKKKVPSFLVVVSYGMAAVIWTVRAVLEIAYGTFETSVIFFVLNILCAVLWIVSFFVTLHRYRSNNKEK